MLKHLVLRLLCAGLFGGAVMVDANPRLMVVDVDGGLDDEWALLTLLRAQHLGLVRILAITAVDGMTDINNVCVNTCRLLQVAQAPDIPMYRGIKNKDRETDYLYLYGKDGFGDLDWGWKPDLSRVKGMSAIEALARLTKEHPGEISLLCLGPLTNIAEAMRLQPDIASNLQEILIMGGNDPGKFGELGAEFNFLTDPESANAILTQAKVPIMLLPVETCLNIELNFTRRTPQSRCSIESSANLWSFVISRIQPFGGAICSWRAASSTREFFRRPSRRTPGLRPSDLEEGSSSPTTRKNTTSSSSPGSTAGSSGKRS
nr:PREDICTED: uridine nucleosidase 1-like isoform X3 [Bemisia tabaci]